MKRSLPRSKSKDAEIESLKTEVAALRERLGQTSFNASQPPSSDAPHHRLPSRREASGKRQGAQVGYQGHGRSLKPVEEVDHIVNLRPARCCRCGRRLAGDDPQPARDQVAEIPLARADVTEYRRYTLCCTTCGVERRCPTGQFRRAVASNGGVLDRQTWIEPSRYDRSLKRAARRGSKSW